MTRTDALYAVDSAIIDDLRARLAIAELERAALIRALLTHGELTILGKPVRAEVSWPEGQPYGLTSEQIAAMAAPQEA